jgi:hypothetical protein
MPDLGCDSAGRKKLKGLSIYNGLHHGRRTFSDKGPQPLLRDGSRAARVNMVICGVLKLLISV